MENLIPILIGLLILGYRQYRKSQKAANKVAPKEQAENDNYTETLDGFIESFFGVDKSILQGEPTEIKPPEIPDEISWEEKMHISEPESIEYMDNPMETTEENIQFEMIQNKPLKDTEKIDFDLRKAIIYDAIMNPPYLQDLK